MNFWQRWRATRNQVRFDELIRQYMAGESPKIAQDFSVSGESALKFTAVFACLRVLAETFASVPIFEYRRVSDDERKKTDDTGLYDILHYAFNDDMTAYNAKEMGMNQINLGGNAYFEKIPNMVGGLHSLYPLSWERVTVDVDKDTNRITYLIDNKQSDKRNRDAVFHVCGPSLNGVVGMSPIEYAAQAVRLGITYETFQKQFYQNGAVPSGVFEHPTFLKEDAYNRLKKSLKKEWAGLMNAGTAMLLEDGMKFNQLTMKLIDAELLGSKRFQIEDICRIYRVPLHLVQNLDRATNNNIEHQSLEFAMYTMLPHFKRWEENINAQLLSREQRSAGYYFEFNMSALLRGDQKSMAEAFAMGREWGWLSVNDIRRMMNLNRIENGDIYLQPLNMVEAGKQPINGDIREEIEDLIKKGRGHGVV